MQEKPATGQSIDSYCRKCALSTDHTIMRMDAETIAAVRCKTCGSTHAFRSPAEETAARKPRAKRGAAEAATAEMVWEAGLAAATGKEQDYSMTAKYRVGDIVNHRTFGRGVVLRVYASKCGMLFRDGEKLMVSANP